MDSNLRKSLLAQQKVVELNVAKAELDSMRNGKAVYIKKTGNLYFLSDKKDVSAYLQDCLKEAMSECPESTSWQ